jgi:hypothetical protein
LARFRKRWQGSINPDDKVQEIQMTSFKRYRRQGSKSAGVKDKEIQMPSSRNTVGKDQETQMPNFKMSRWQGSRKNSDGKVQESR